MFHLLAFTTNEAIGGTNVDVPGVTDGYAPLTNNHYLLPKDMKILASFAMGAFITRARINTPRLRAISLPSISPLEVAAAVSDIPPICFYGDYAPQIAKIDELAVETSNNSAGLDRHIVGLWVGDNAPRPASPGPCFSVRFTAANTGGNLSWGESTITLEQTLPAGRYQVVGLDVFGANLVFARLRFPESGMLPGVLARAAANLMPDHRFRFGRLGLYGEFENTAPPLLSIFGTAAGTTQEGFLDLVKVS